MQNFTKYIYWIDDKYYPPKENGERYALIHLLVGYNQAMLSDYQDMANEMRKTFPYIKDDEIHCSDVKKSKRVKNFTIITFNGYIPYQEYDGWFDLGNRNPEYYH